MSQRRPVRRFIALAAIAALALTGCSSSEKPETAPAVEVSGDSEETLRAAYQYGTESLDPHTATGAYSPVTLELIFDTLIRVQADGSLAPGLAEEWHFSDDQSQLILQIREGVTFSDGTALDAETVKKNLDRARGVDFDQSAVTGDLSMVESVEVDGSQVIIGLAEGLGGALPSVLSDRAGMIASSASLDDPEFDLKPIGAGPYQVSSYDPGASLNLERWDGYWDESVDRNAKVELSYVSDSSARLRGVQGGQFDWTTVDAVQVADAELANLEILSNPTFAYNRITVNRSREWFQNPLVREAMSYAVDRDALVQGLLFGKGKPAYQPFPDGFWAASPDAKAPSYDPDRAKELLAEAGYPDGFAFEAVAANTPGATQVAEAVAAQLAEVGIDVKIRLVDNSTVTFYANKESDAWIGPWSGRADPALTLSLQFTQGKLQNPGGTSSDEIEAAAKEALKPGTQEDREQALQAFTQQVLDENLDIFLFFPELNQVFTDSVTGAQEWITDKPSLRNVVKR